MNTLAIRACLVLGVLVFGADAVRASDELDVINELSAIRTEVVIADRIAGEFENLAGSPVNAQNLVVGMRNAKPVALTTAGPAKKATRFEPTKRPMSFADIHIALSLAQAQLKSQRIDSPTPEQIRASLAGGQLPNANGDMQTVVGILPMHRGGMNWEEIAEALRVTAPKRASLINS